MKYFSSLKLKDFISLIILIAAGFAWIKIDQIILNQATQRFIAFGFVLLLLFYLQYRVNRPSKVWLYVNSIALTVVVIEIFVSTIIHVLIRHDFSSKSVKMWIISAFIPYLAGYIYKKTRKNPPQ